MLKKSFPILIILLVVLFLYLIFSNNNAPLTKEALIKDATRLLEKGQPQSALELVEENAENFSGDVSILKLMGLAHQKLGDPYTASAIFLSAYELEPENTSLLILNFKCQKEAGLNLEDLIIKVAEQAPDTLEASDWRKVSKIYSQKGAFKLAIEAQFKALGTRKPSKDISAEYALNIAQNYLRLKDTGASKPWLKLVAQSESIESLSAQLSLIDLEFKAQNWKELNQYLVNLESRFPGALASSQYADIDSMIQKAKAQPAQKGATSKVARQSTGSSKDLFNDIEDLDQLANRIAQASNTSALDLEDGSAQGNQSIQYNPEISIQPADPYTDGVPSSANLDNSNISDNKSAPAPSALDPEAVELLIVKANNAVLENDLSKAAEIYRQILESYPKRHDLWSRLSQVYLANEELRSAEETALEAIKLRPNNIPYTLDYLIIAQKTKSEVRLLSELISASKRFPNNPQITLSLARAYDRTNRNNFKAVQSYKQFITLAPNNSLRSEAESAIERLSK